MREYLVSVVAMSVFCALVSYFSYPSGTARASKLSLSVLLIYTVSMPLVSLFSGFGAQDAPSLEVPDADFGGGEYVETAKEAFEDGIALYIMDKFGADADDVFVECYGFDFEAMRAERISVTLSGRGALLDYRGIENKVTGLGLGECEVYIKIG